MVTRTLLNLAVLRQTRAQATILASGDYARTKASLAGAEVLTDSFGNYDAECYLVRVASGASVAIEIENVGRVESFEYGGWTCIADGGAMYWLPAVPTLRRLNDFEQIIEERSIGAPAFSYDQGILKLNIDAPAGAVVDVIVWRLGAGALQRLRPGRDAYAVERQAFFLWGSHTRFTRLADLYLHLIHGHIYENRFAWPHKRRICSENDAHSLFVVLTGLYRATADPLYDLARRQVVYSVIARQGEDGGWRHGEWTEFRESHFRLHASAMHMLMDAGAEAHETLLAESLDKAVAFAARQTDETDLGTWLLHDELETREDWMAQCPLKWTKSRALGKSVTNQLVLNTHLDTLVALSRYSRSAAGEPYAELIDSAYGAALQVLSLAPMETLYRLVFWMLSLNLLPTSRARRLPLPVRALKRFAREYMGKPWRSIKTRYPRIIMPGGYVDRALSVGAVSDAYLGINMMDILRAHRMRGHAILLEAADGAKRFVDTGGILQRWAENGAKQYASGFYGEALYHLYMLTGREDLKAALCELAVNLVRGGIGISPSWLGTNAEAVAPADQARIPFIRDPELVTINLSAASGPLFLVVNTGLHAIDLGAHGGPELKHLENPLQPEAWVEITGRGGD